MTRGFRLKSLNQELKIAKLLAKLRLRRDGCGRFSREEAASFADQQGESARRVAARLGYLALAPQLVDGRLKVAAATSHNPHCDNWNRIL